MVQEQHRFIRGLLLLVDVLVLELAWGIAYWVRFHSGLAPVPPATGYDASIYVLPIVLIPIVWPTTLRWLKHSARTSERLGRTALDLVNASTLTLLGIVAIAYFIFKVEISRLTLGTFWIIGTAALFLARLVFRAGMRIARRRGFHLRRVLVVGGEELAAAYIERAERDLELGLKVAGVLIRDEGMAAPAATMAPILGSYVDLGSVLRAIDIDEVVIALPYEDQSYLPGILSAMEDDISDVKVIPDFHCFPSLRGGVEEFDGLALINLRTSPLVGWNFVAKRAVDLVLGSIAFLIFAPLMLVIAVFVKLTDGGPVLYRQERMGLDGRLFQMLKFRSMRVDAEAATGPVWARASDPRVTWIGRILRKTSLDELPQLWNVLKGEMSLAGPRPERPALVQRFRSEVPLYMLRHKIKAGMTGWAQVNGWRGDTSLKHRLEYDLYYIQHWSVGLDLKILALTIRRGFFDKNAY